MLPFCRSKPQRLAGLKLAAMAKPTELPGDVAPPEPPLRSSRVSKREGSPRRFFASSDKELDEISEGETWFRI